MAQFASIARIVKKRGVRGEVAAELLTDFPERFSSLDQVRIFNGETEYWEEIEKHWFHKNRVILKFRGRDRPEEVEELIGGDVQVSEDQRVSLPQDSYFHSDLIGCQVLEDEEVLGGVTGILETGTAGCNLVVTRADGGEFMVPLVRKFVLKVDVGKKVIQVNLPSGLV
ncbi:MAG: 16S rRNA processing protein RimM [Acidobacteria bacterium]|nr:MAG: 16S rRNA processing protein RimM [Acidobacteriota bacterium]